MAETDLEKLTDFMVSGLDRTAFVVNAQLDGLSHEDCLLQLPFRGNCANWVLGHIISSRSSMIQRITGESYWDDDVNSLYKFNSEPITDGENALHLDHLLEHLQNSAEALKSAIQGASREQLETIWNEERQSSVLDFLLFMTWHEGYHAGQFEYLRQLAGKNDKVI
ncbi:MAG: DinB family protein [Anaerolineaceae bacterium]|nr:DinB family protein [Anaerolineaceae bacterium]